MTTLSGSQQLEKKLRPYISYWEKQYEKSLERPRHSLNDKKLSHMKAADLREYLSDYVLEKEMVSLFEASFDDDTNKKPERKRYALTLELSDDPAQISTDRVLTLFSDLHIIDDQWIMPLAQAFMERLSSERELTKLSAILIYQGLAMEKAVYVFKKLCKKKDITFCYNINAFSFGLMELTGIQVFLLQEFLRFSKEHGLVLGGSSIVYENPELVEIHSFGKEIQSRNLAYYALGAEPPERKSSFGASQKEASSDLYPEEEVVTLPPNSWMKTIPPVD